MTHASINRIYRLVFNAATGMYVAVAETAKGRGKGGRSCSAAMLAALTAIGGAGGLSAAGAQGLPTGGVAVTNNVSFSQTSNTLTMVQTGSAAVVNWNSFSVAAGNTVNINQQSASSVMLNRVVGNSMSEIFGSINAIGKVMLINQNGILMGAGSQVNTGGFLASTLNIKDTDFLAGKYIFDIANNTGGTAGNIINNGRINTPSGYAVLIAPQVTNNGFIAARQGVVAIGAGNKVSLDMVGDGLISLKVDQAALNAAIVNTGTIEANGGTVLLKASSANALFDTVINSSGIIRADSISTVNGRIILDGGAKGITEVTGEISARGQNTGETGGSISVLGDKVGLLGSAKLDASGDAGGGTVLVGGNWQGNGPERNASRTIVGSNASIDVSATNNGNGGTAVVWADGRTDMSGTVKATGGANGGNGGNVETSGKGALDLQGSVDVTAKNANGTGGQWLLDPIDITIASLDGNLDGAVISPDFQDNGGGTNATVSAGSLGIALTGGATVNVQTSNAGVGGTGAITVNNAINATGAGTLNLIANGAINVNAAITNFAGSALNVGLYAGSTGTPATIATAGGQAGAITTAAGGTITTNGGKVTMVSGSNSAIILGGAITTSNGNVSLKSGGALTVNAGLNAGTGIVRIQATGAVTQSAAGSVASGTTGVRAASVDLSTSGGNTGAIAINASTGVAKYRTAGGFDVSMVAADGTFALTNGVTTNNQDITLVNQGTTLRINNVVNAGTGTVRLVSSSDMFGNATGVITAANLAVSGTNTGSSRDFDLSSATHAVSGNVAFGANSNVQNFKFKNSTGFTVGAVTADGSLVAATTGISNGGVLTINAGGTIRQTEAITQSSANTINVTTTAGNINLSNANNGVRGTVNLSAAAGGVAFTNASSNGIKVGDITAATSTNSTVATDIANFTASDAALTGVVLLRTASSKNNANIERVGATKIVADRTVLVAEGRIGGALANDAGPGIRVEGAAGASARQVFVSAGGIAGGGTTAHIFGPTTVPQFYNGLMNGATALPSPTSTTYNNNAMTLSAASTATPVVVAAAAAATTPATASTNSSTNSTTNTGNNEALRRAQTVVQIQQPKSNPPTTGVTVVTTPRAEQANAQVNSDRLAATRVEPITIPSCLPGAARQAAPGQCG